MQRLSSLFRSSDEHGSALIEFALVLPILAVVVFGITDFGRALNYWLDETHLANEAARFAVVNKKFDATHGCPAAVVTANRCLQWYVQRQGTTAELRDGDANAAIKPADRLKICIDFYGKADADVEVGDPVRVTATASFTWLPIVGISATKTEIGGKSTMRVEVEPTNYSQGCYPA